MVYNKFEGIRHLSGNKVASEYLNVVPFGNYVADREGRRLADDSISPVRNYTDWVNAGDWRNDSYVLHGDIRPTASECKNAELRLCFKTSMNFITKVWTIPFEGQHKLRYDENYTFLVVEYISPSGEMFKYAKFIVDSRPGPIPEDKIYSKHKFGDEWSWCESSTKPEQLYFTDGTIIFWSNSPFESEEYQTFVLNSLPSPKFVPVSKNGWFLFNGGVAAYDPPTESHDHYEKTIMRSIFWYDNRLGIVEYDNSTVWLTCTDPAQWYRNDDKSDDWYDIDNGINNLWTAFYASTLTRSYLQRVVPHGGQLFFFNTDNIETWVRTGNEDAPLNSTTAAPFVFSTIDAREINGTLFIFGKSETRELQLWMMRNGQYSQLTNDAISSQLTEDLRIDWVNLRDSSFIRLCNDVISFCVNPGNGFWCKLYDGQDSLMVKWYVDNGEAYDREGNSYVFSKDIHMIDGKPKNRELTEYFDIFKKRMTFPMVNLLVDTDDYNGDVSHDSDTELAEIMLSVSNDKGNTFPVRLFRKIPKLGNGAENICWRNVGSGFSMLLNFKYNCIRNVLLYGIELDNK